MSSISNIPSNLFTGTSNFASTLSQVLTRAVSIASLPVQSLQAQQTDLQNRQNALQGLDSVFSNLQSSIQNLQSTVQSGLLSASVSDSSVAVTVGANATPASFTIQVGSLGSYSTALSAGGSTPVSDPTTQGISSSNTYTLNVNGAPTSITASDSSLSSLASAINSQAGSQVQAVVVNVGSPGSPDYRLSLQSSQLGANTLDLTDSNGNSLITSSNQGSLASYSIDGSATVSSSSRNITIAPGVTATLQNTTGQTTNITVADSPTTLLNAFNSFAQAYNSAVTALGQYHGQNGGVLEGDSIISTLGGVLSQLGTYDGGSVSTALANYGITVDQTGQLSVNSAAFTTAANSNFSGLLQTLGSSTTGGFLQSATNTLNSVEDPTVGILKLAETQVGSEITAQQTKISNAQANLSTIQSNLQQQIAKADASIASLESQVSYVGGLFASAMGTTNSSAYMGATTAQLNPTQL